jgi:hypothetical protein
MALSTGAPFFSCLRLNRSNGPLAELLLQSRAQRAQVPLAKGTERFLMRNLTHGSFPFPLMILTTLWYAALPDPFRRLRDVQHLAMICRTGPGGDVGTSQPLEAS